MGARWSAGALHRRRQLASDRSRARANLPEPGRRQLPDRRPAGRAGSLSCAQLSSAAFAQVQPGHSNVPPVARPETGVRALLRLGGRRRSVRLHNAPLSGRAQRGAPPANAGRAGSTGVGGRDAQRARRRPALRSGRLQRAAARLRLLRGR